MTVLERYIPGFRGFPSLFSYTLLLGAGFGAFVTWDQWYWWGRREDYSFGYLVPIFVAVVVWDRWPQLMALLGIGPKSTAEKGRMPSNRSQNHPI